MAVLRIGTCSWKYPSWHELVYSAPKGINYLAEYAEHYDTVEVDQWFWSLFGADSVKLPSPFDVERYRSSVPDGFRFAVKASRFITHVKRLRAVEEPLETFLERAGILDDKLGPILYQLPPSVKRDDALLERVLALLPAGLRHVVEFRDASWYHDRVFDMLRCYDVAFCMHDMRGSETPVVATTGFAYIRFHGTSGYYSGRYTDAELDGWAERIRHLGPGLSTTYVYFNNDIGGHAVRNAATLAGKLADSGEM